jgi:hypothetical protein
MFTADHVWGLAVAADRINGGYVKADVYAENLDVVQKQANKTMVKGWLRNNQTPQQQQTLNVAVRFATTSTATYSSRSRARSTTLNPLRCVSHRWMSSLGKNLLEFSVVSCLPSVMLRDQSRKELKNAISSSVQLAGEVGEKITGEIEVFRCDYQQTYDKFIIQARMGDSYVSFWFSSRIDGAVTIRAKIKEQRGDNTTALNFVKIIG